MILFRSMTSGTSEFISTLIIRRDVVNADLANGVHIKRIGETYLANILS
jgi:hypothetical protein